MTDAERDALIQRIIDPPPGDPLARARDYGFDLTIIVRNVLLSDEERVHRVTAMLRQARALRRARRVD